MLHTVSQRNTGWMVVALLFMGSLVALLIGLLQPYVGLLALLLTLVATIGYAQLERQPRRAARRVAKFRAPSALPVRSTVVTSYGAELQAQVVPIEREDDYQFVLTSEGYMLTDENGRVIHRLQQRNDA